MALSQTRPANQVPRGIALRIGAAISFAVMAALLKIAADRGVTVPEMLFYRSIFGLPVVLLWVLAGDGLGALKTQRPMAHVMRSGLGTTAMFFAFKALALLPLAEATTISFTAPIFATILSWLILREKVGRHRWFAAILAFAGVIIVMRPGAAHAPLPPFGIALGLMAAVGAAGVTVTLRRVRDTEHVAAIVCWFLVTCSVVGLLLLPFYNSSPDYGTIAIMAAAGAIGGLAQILMTASLQAAPIAVLTPFDYLQLLAAALLGWLLLDNDPTVNTYAGALLIGSSGLYTAWREHRRRLRDELPATQPIA